MNQFINANQETIRFSPYVSESSPRQFSINGDVEITFTGLGFNGDQRVVFVSTDGENEFECKITKISYTELKCHLERISTSLTSSDFDLTGYLIGNPRGGKGMNLRIQTYIVPALGS